MLLLTACKAGHGPRRQRDSDTVACCCSQRVRQDTGPADGVTATRSRAAAHSVRGRNLKVKPPVPLLQTGNGSRVSGEWPGHWGGACGCRKRPRVTHSSVGPAESWLRKIHRVCVYLSVWLCADTALDMWPDTDNGRRAGLGATQPSQGFHRVRFLSRNMHCFISFSKRNNEEKLGNCNRAGLAGRDTRGDIMLAHGLPRGDPRAPRRHT